MDKGQRILTTVLWGVAVLAMLGLVGTGLWAKRHHESRQHAEGEAALASGRELFATPGFSLLDQNSRPVSDESLRGRVWIADFIFTNCADPCPKMSAMMSELQGLLQHPDIKLVSFTVDPQRDTPEVLKRYAEQFNADDSRWLFLSGTPEQMQAVAAGMKIAAERSTDDSITHSTWFLLIDRDGQVRGLYRQSDPDDFDRLATDAMELAERSAEPSR
jgi:protein SCO1/2